MTPNAGPPGLTTQETVRHILTSYATWAVVGASPDPVKPAHFVPAYMQARGYRIIPVNPLYAGEDILGERCYGTLAEVPEDAGVEVVDLFRRAQFVPDHVAESIAVGAKAVWMQAGIVHDQAARTAEEAGLSVVMDRCPKIEIPALGNSFRPPAPTS